MRQLLARLRLQLEQQFRANPRLLLAIPLIAVLVMLMCWQALDAARVQAQKQSIESEVNLRRIRGLQGQDVWIGRAQQARRIRQQLEAELPLTRTSGLAQAAVQSWLTGIAQATTSAPDKVRVSIESAAVVEELPQVLRVRASVSGAAPANQAINMIRQIEQSKNLVFIETVNIRSDQNNLFSLTVNAYYRLADQATAEANPK